MWHISKVLHMTKNEKVTRVNIVWHYAKKLNNLVCCYLQEFMLMPIGASSFTEAMRMASETYHTLKEVIKAKYGIDACNVGDEGGFAPDIQSGEEGLELLKTAIDKAGYTGKVFIAMDAAASEFFKNVCLQYRLLHQCDGSFRLC